MLLDVECECSKQQDLAAAVGTVKSTRSFDFWNGQLTAPVDNLGNTIPSDAGRGPTGVMCVVTETFDSGGDTATVEAQLVSADDEDLSVNVVVHRTTGAIAQATLIAGYELQLGPLLPSGITKKWGGFRYLIGTEATTAGKVSSYIGNKNTQRGWES